MQGATALDAALAATALLGFRHGFDYDHVAAISDITGVQKTPRAAMRAGFAYVLGHAAMVCALGLAAIGFRRSVPSSVDTWAEALVGVTLIVLGVWILRTLFQRGAHTHSDARPKTRITLAANAFLWLWWRAQRLLGNDDAQRRELFRDGYGEKSSFAVGIIHGVGAETPTQLGVFLLAAHLGGFTKGLLGLLFFTGGLVSMNMLMCAAATGIFGAASRRRFATQALTVVTAAYSLGAGLVFIVLGVRGYA